MTLTRPVTTGVELAILQPGVSTVLGVVATVTTPEPGLTRVRFRDGSTCESSTGGRVTLGRPPRVRGN